MDLCMNHTVKFEGHYKFSFDVNVGNKGKDIRQIDKELKDVAKSQYRTKMWGNKVVVVPTSRRSLGYKGKMDAMQAWDVYVSLNRHVRLSQTSTCMSKPGHLVLATSRLFVEFDCTPRVVL